MNANTLDKKRLRAILDEVLAFREQPDSALAECGLSSATVDSMCASVNNQPLSLSDSTWGDAYLVGLDIAEGVLSTDDPSRPNDFPSSFEVVPIPTSGDASCNERREHRIVALRGAAAVATFRKLKWNAVATVVQPTTKPQPLAEIKPPAQAPVTKAGLRISRDDESVKVRHPC